MLIHIIQGESEMRQLPLSLTIIRSAHRPHNMTQIPTCGRENAPVGSCVILEKVYGWCVPEGIPLLVHCIRQPDGMPLVYADGKIWLQLTDGILPNSLRAQLQAYTVQLCVVPTLVVRVLAGSQRDGQGTQLHRLACVAGHRVQLCNRKVQHRGRWDPCRRAVSSG